MVDHPAELGIRYSAVNLHSVPVFLVHVIAGSNLLIPVPQVER